MIIDMHTHIFPDTMAEGALTKLSAIGGIPVCSDGTARGLLDNMIKSGVDYSVVLNVATNPAQVDNVNAFAVQTREKQEKLIPFGSLHPRSEGVRETVKKLKDSGIKGIKLHPDYVRTAVDDSGFDHIFKAAAEMDMPVVIHAGWDFISPDFVHASPEAILRVLERYPGLKLICAHFGGYMLWDEVRRKLCGKNVYFDTALACGRFGMTREKAEDIIASHDGEKILFGSDLPWCGSGEVIDFIHSLNITEEQKERIFYKNAQKLLNLT